MDKVLVTALLIIGSVTAAMVVLMTIGPSVASGSQAVLESSNEVSKRLQTNIEIIAVATNTGGTQLDVWVKNVGVAPILGIDKSDVFVITPGTRFDAMTHAASGDDTWTEQPSGAS